MDLLLATEGALLSSTSPSSLSTDPPCRVTDSIRNLSKYDTWDSGRSETNRFLDVSVLIKNIIIVSLYL